MKTLRESLHESLLDIKDVEASVDPTAMTIMKIDDWCKDNVRGNYVINKKTLTINSSASITITNRELIEFPSYIHFGTVRINFSCDNCTSLKSLVGAPEKVGKNFSCANCTSLESLEGAPKEVGRAFYCKFFC